MSRSSRAQHEMSDSLWEKLLLVAACVIAVSLAVAGARREFFHHSPDAASTTVQSGGAVQPTEQSSSDVAGVAATPVRKVPQRVQAEPTATPPARTGCDALRGVHDRTRVERQWFLDNCMFLSRRAAQASTPAPPEARWRAILQAAGFSLAEPAPSRSATEMDATPPAWLSAPAAIDMASSWLMANSPVAVTIDPSACIPIWINGHWVVTCDVHLTGCSGPLCVASLAMCVFTSDPMVVPDLRC